MAWTAGVTRTTGDLITAADWNSYLGAAGSLDYLKGEVDTAIQNDGAVAFIGNQSMGGNRLTNVGATVASGDAARKTDVDTVDNKLDDISHSEPSRAVNTNYQNSTKIRLVAISIALDANSTCDFYIGSASPPTTKVGVVSKGVGAGSIDNLTMMFAVPPSWYYKATAAGDYGLSEWHEWDLL